MWVHAVSVGEVLAASGVVAGLVEAGFRVALSTTTEAGQELAKGRFGGCPVFYMPLDFGWLVGRYLRVIRPRLVVTMESELWPNLIHACKTQGIPLAVVNARVSDRSFPRYIRLRGVWGPLLREVRLFLAQSEETAGRLREMSVAADRVKVSGNLKYDVRVGAVSEITRRVGSMPGVKKLVVCGSTVPDEEVALLEAWPKVKAAVPEAVLLVAPRHLDRVEEVMGVIGAGGLKGMRCSHSGAGDLPGGDQVLVLDTIGDLASMYSVGALAFVGGSVVARGGHNPLEAAQFGVPVMMGHSFFNFREIVGAMREARAIRIVSREDLGEVMVELLRDDGGMGERGRRLFAAQAGATERTVVALLGLMEGGQ